MIARKELLIPIDPKDYDVKAWEKDIDPKNYKGEKDNLNKMFHQPVEVKDEETKQV